MKFGVTVYWAKSFLKTSQIKYVLHRGIAVPTYAMPTSMSPNFSCTHSLHISSYSVRGCITLLTVVMTIFFLLLDDCLGGNVLEINLLQWFISATVGTVQRNEKQRFIHGVSFGISNMSPDSVWCDNLHRSTFTLFIPFLLLWFLFCISLVYS